MPHYYEMPCPECRQGLRVRSEYLGRRVRCQYCGHTWNLPQAGSEPDSVPPRPNGGPSGTAVVGWSWTEAPRGSVSLLGDYDLLEEIAHGDMTAVHRARHRPDGRIVTLRIEGKVWPEGGEAIESASRSGSVLTIPGYTILTTVRDGAMGRVYKALQESLDRLVAIKALRGALCRSPEYRARFLREAKLSARLAHHHFIQTIDRGEVGGRPYYVMEYVEGETLESHLERRGVMKEGAAITIALGLAEAVRHAHQRGVIHRDIKPANVILATGGGLKLADLGLARAVDDHEWAASEAGMAVGTPEYISPEQIRGQVDVDVRSDIYSLGATLYRLVTGRVPYGGETTREVMSKHLGKDHVLVPPEQINPAISAQLSAVVLTMLARNREDRYRNPDELIFALCGLLGSRAPRALTPDLRTGELRPAAVGEELRNGPSRNG